MTQLQRLAALLILLGEETSRLLLQSFAQAQAQPIVDEWRKCDPISLEEETAILREFTEFALRSNQELGGSVEYTRAVLERAVGLYKSAQIFERLAHLGPVETPSPPPEARLSSEDIHQIVDQLSTARSKRPAPEHASFPEQITIEVLKQLTRENSWKMSVAACLWASGEVASLPPKAATAPLAGIQKLAALFLLLGEETAAMLLGYFDDSECEKMAWEMAMLQLINLEQQAEILKEFTERALRDIPQETPMAPEEPAGRMTAESARPASPAGEDAGFKDLETSGEDFAMDLGQGPGPSPTERITIEVLKALTRENPSRMSGIARTWLNA